MLKKLTSLLLSKFYPRTEPDTVGRMALPYTNNDQVIWLRTGLSVETWENSIITGTAPYDGYLVLSATNTNLQAGTLGSLTIRVGDNILTTLLYPFPGADGQASAPIPKGVSYSISGSCSESISLRFCKTVGETIKAGKDM